MSRIELTTTAYFWLVLGKRRLIHMRRIGARYALCGTGWVESTYTGDDETEVLEKDICKSCYRAYIYEELLGGRVGQDT